MERYDLSATPEASTDGLEYAPRSRAGIILRSFIIEEYQVVPLHILISSMRIWECGDGMP